MPVTDDEMYRQLSEDYRHHLRWREKLFGGFLVLVGALAAFYYTHAAAAKQPLPVSWVIPLVGAALSASSSFSSVAYRKFSVIVETWGARSSSVLCVAVFLTVSGGSALMWAGFRTARYSLVSTESLPCFSFLYLFGTRLGLAFSGNCFRPFAMHSDPAARTVSERSPNNQLDPDRRSAGTVAEEEERAWH